MIWRWERAYRFLSAFLKVYPYCISKIQSTLPFVRNTNPLNMKGNSLSLCHKSFTEMPNRDKTQGFLL